MQSFFCRTVDELDLTKQSLVESFLQQEKPDYVFLAAAQSRRIHANITYPADFIYSNLQIQINIIHAAYQSGVKNCVFWAAHASIQSLLPSR